MINNISVRIATPKDGDFIKLAVRQLIQLCQNTPTPPQVKGIDQCWEKIMSDPKKNAVFVAESNGKPVGAAVCTFEHVLHCGGEVCNIQDLIINQNVRSSGIGKKLIQYVEEYSKKRGVRAIDLSQPPNDTAGHQVRTQFYTKCGFTMLGPTRLKPLDPDCDIDPIKKNV